MIRLYRNALQPRHWVAYAPGTGWVAFPAKEKGWDDRHPARGLDPLYLREVPLEAAANAGIPVGDLQLVEVA